MVSGSEIPAGASKETKGSFKKSVAADFLKGIDNII